MKMLLLPRSHHSSSRRLFSAGLLFLLLSLSQLPGAQLKEARVSQVIKDVKLIPAQAAPRPASVKDEVRDGTAVRTGVESRAELTFTDQTLARLGANTIFSFNEGTRNLELSGGAMLLRVPKDSGGAQINTAAVTAAITGTTVMLEYHPDAYIKFIVLEGTGRVFRKGRVGESVLVHAGQMLIINPKGKNLPDPVDVDLKRLVRSSLLITAFDPIASLDLIWREIEGQATEKSKGDLIDTNLVIFGSGTVVSLLDATRSDIVDQATATDSQEPASSGDSSPTPLPSARPSITPAMTPPPTVTPVPTTTPRPTATPRPTVTPKPTVTPTPPITPTPTPVPSITPSPTPTISPTATPTITPSPTPSPSATPGTNATYNGGTGNWSDPQSWTPGFVPNNGNNGIDYDVFFSSGILTQDIVAGVTINQLFMSGGTLILAHPLTLEAGLQFSGGSITSGTLNVAGSSTQSARMVVNGTTINNSGSYNITLTGWNVFSGGNSTFNNSGTLAAQLDGGAASFNVPLNNSGTVSAESGTFSLTRGGTMTGTAAALAGATLQFASDFAFSDGAAFSGPGLIEFKDSTSSTFSGRINNGGNVLINSTGSFTDFVLNGDVTFSGGGVLSLVNADRICGSGIFTNADNTIQGETSNSGSLGTNEVGIVNQTGGVIDANVCGLTLKVDPNSADGLVNQGMMEAVDGGILQLSGYDGGTFTNSGTIKALTGGALRFTGAVTSSNLIDVGSDSLSITAHGSYTQTAGTFRLAGGRVISSTALNFMAGLIDARGRIRASLTNGGNLQPAIGGTGLFVSGAVTLLSSSRLTFQLGGLTQGSQYGFLNVNGTVALGGRLVVSFVNAFPVTNNSNFTVLRSTNPLAGAFANVASGGRVNTSHRWGSFLVTYSGHKVILSDFQRGNVVAPLPGDGSAASGVLAIRKPPEAARLMTSDEPRSIGAVRRTIASPARTQKVGMRLENTDQLRDLLDGAEATTAQGRVIIHPPRQTKPAGPAHQTNSQALTNGKVDRRGQSPGDSISRRQAVVPRGIAN